MIYKNAFFANKDTGRSDYNFNLKELTENFSFLDFVFDVQRGEAKYYGGFVVCTPKQYIVGYNAKFGSGSHNASYARFIKDMQGGGKIFSDEDLLRLSNICKNKYIYAKILYEQIDCNSFGRPVFGGYITFYLPNNINEELYSSFRKFCENYGSELSIINRRPNNNLKISCCLNENKKDINCNDLDSICKYIEEHINCELDDEYERIIGIPVKEKTLIRSKNLE